MKLTPFIIMNGQAEEALNYYCGIFDGKITWMGRYVDCMPDIPDSHKQHIIHSDFEFDGNKLSICDVDPGKTADLGSNGHSLTVSFDTVEQAKAIYDKMLNGSLVRCPFGEAFFAKAYAELTDRFGVAWNLIVE